MHHGDESWASAELEIDDEDSRVCSVVVTSGRGLSPGDYTGLVTLKGTLPDGSVLPGQSFQIQTRIVQDIELIPRTLMFGTIAVGQRAEKTVVLRSRTATPFILGSDIRSDCPSIVATRDEGAVPNRAGLRVVAHPNKAGLKEGLLWLDVSFPSDGTVQDVSVPFWYVGLLSDRSVGGVR